MAEAPSIGRNSPLIGAALRQHRKLAGRVQHGKTLSHRIFIEHFAQSLRKRCWHLRLALSLASDKADLALSVQSIARQCYAQVLDGASPLTRGTSRLLALLFAQADVIQAI